MNEIYLRANNWPDTTEVQTWTHVKVKCLILRQQWIHPFGNTAYLLCTWLGAFTWAAYDNNIFQSLKKRNFQFLEALGYPDIWTIVMRPLGLHLPSDPTGKAELSYVGVFTHTLYERGIPSRAWQQSSPSHASGWVVFQDGVTHNLFQGGGGGQSLFLKGILFHPYRLGQECNSK